MRPYLAIFRMRFVAGLQYRVAALAGISTQYAWGFMLLLSFHSFYRADPAAFPMSFPQLSSYIWLQQGLLAMFMLWFYEADILDAIRSGSIAYELARPMDLYNRWFAQATATRLSRTLLRCVPVFLVAFLLPAPYGLRLPPNLQQFLLFLVSAALSLGVLVAFSMLIYLSCFYTLSSQGLRTLAVVLVDILSGAIIPLPFLPDALQRALAWLPFASMQNLPLRLWSGQIPAAEAGVPMLLQLVWLLLLVAGGRRWMASALRRVVVQGG